MGTRMAPELRPRGLDPKLDPGSYIPRITFISDKNWRGGMGNSQPKGKIGHDVQGIDMLFYLLFGAQYKMHAQIEIMQKPINGF